MLAPALDCPSTREPTQREDAIVQDSAGCCVLSVQSERMSPRFGWQVAVLLKVDPYRLVSQCNLPQPVLPLAVGPVRYSGGGIGEDRNWQTDIDVRSVVSLQESIGPLQDARVTLLGLFRKLPVPDAAPVLVR